MRRVVICLAFLAWVLHPLSTAGAPAKPAAQPSAARQKPSEKNKPSTGVTDDKEGHEKGSDDKAKTSSKSPGEKKTWLEVFAGNVSTVRSLVADFILLAVMLSFGWAVLSEMRRTSVIIDPIEVPKDLTDAGFTPQVVAQRIAGEIIALRRQAKVRESLEEGYELSTTQLDFTVPAAGLSYRSLIRYARQLLHRPEQLVQGEIVRRLEAPAAADSGTASGTLSITLRTRERKTISVASGEELPDLLKSAALEIAELVDPYMVANYWFWRDQQDQNQDFERTIDSVPKCLARTSPAEHHRAYVGWANALTMKRDFAAAEEKYATAAFLDPCFAPTFNGWGNLKRRQRRYDEAAAMYRRAIDRDRKHTAAWSNLGYTCNDRHKTRAAIRYFDRAISIDLRAASPRTGQALSFWKLGRIEWAEAAFRRAIDLDPDFGWSYLHWARLLGAQGRFAEALDLVRIAVERGSKLEGYGARGDLQLKMGNFAQAEASYRQAIEADPRSANGFSGLARLRLRQRDPVGAIQMCERALEIDHFFMNALGIWADALWLMRRDEEATAKYREMLALDPYQVRAHVGMGHIARIRHRWSDAFASFERALAIDSRDGWAWRSWGQTLIDLHRFREAEKKLRCAVAVEPFESSGHAQLGNALALQGKRESALDPYRRACELDGRNTDAWRQQADILIQLGKPDDALALLAGAVVAWPGEARMQLELGRALWRLGRNDEALRSFELAVSVAPRDAEILRTWANALPATPEGQDLALRLLVRAVAAEPWNESATVDLGRIFHRLGLIEVALRWFERAHHRSPESVAILVGWSEMCIRTANRLPEAAAVERERRFVEAEEKLRLATQLEPWNTWPLRRWAELRWQRGSVDQALAKLAKATEIDSADWQAWRASGELHLASRRFGAAISAYKRAIVFNPADPDLLIDFGNALKQAGKRAKAMANLERALVLRPADARASKLLAELRGAQ